MKLPLVVAERVRLGARGGDGHADAHVDGQHRLVVARLRAFHDYHVTFLAHAEKRIKLENEQIWYL